MASERLLDTIKTPHQLRRLTDDQLRQLAGEMRRRIVDVVSCNGGHLASNLGIAELTIALHYVFDFSNDHLLWDVGHQCYAHKLLTGRVSRFDTLRRPGGLSGFPSPAESDYDLFATGHAGTAISTAVGMAWGDQAAGRDTRTVAVVGDGSIVNGLSMEGLNNVAMLKRQFLIVLNDNSMAIDRSQGAMADLLDRIRASHTYADVKQSTETLLRHFPLGEEISDALRHIKDGLRTTLHGANFFESLGVAYFGPVDGHDVNQLIRILRRLATLQQPVLLHVHTQKGRGCQYAVEDPCRFHSPSAYTVESGKAVFASRTCASWTETFADALIDLADEDPRVVAITAAMPDGTGLARFRKAHPDRCLDVGISESHAMAMAAGMARAGKRPVVAIYSTFMQRALDQVFQEVCLQKLPVILCMDRAGLVGSDGAVHHGFMDIAMLRAMPGIVLAAPGDGDEMKAALASALASDRPWALRYPRDEVCADLPGQCPPFEIGASRTVRQGTDGAILVYGAMVEHALAAADELQSDDELNVTVVNARFAKPLDAETILPLLADHRPLVVVEDHAVVGGLGSAVMELAAAHRMETQNVCLLGLPDRFVAHASRAEQLARVGIDAPHVAAAIRDVIRNRSHLTR